MVIFDLAGVFYLVYEEAGEVFYVEGVEVIFHCEVDRFEHFFAF